MATSCNHGEGSSFLSLPTKRNVGFHEPRTGGHTQTGGGSATQSALPVDFKSKLLPRIIAACQPPVPNQQQQPPSSHISAATANSMSPNSQEDLIRKGPLVPSEQQWYTLNQLRIHAGAPERTERGVNRLLQYFAQLCWLEERFPFDAHQSANSGSLMFTWFEAFSPKKQVTTSCLQYEKAAVMWNVGAIYSQLGANQSLWTPEGLRLASQYFLRASSAFLHCRDTLYPRFTCKVDSVSSDLSEETLKAASDLMLAQTMECYYHKADSDNTSSPVTSQIAAQTADYYDISYKAAKLNCSFVKSRFPKFWTSQMRLKMMIYTALGHLHCPNSMTPDMSVGERQSRLRLAMTHITAAIEKHAALNHPTIAGAAVGFLNNATGVKTSADLSIPTISGHLEALLTSTYDQISKALNEVDEANYATFHQTIVKTHELAPLKRPLTSLISKFDLVNGEVGTGSVMDRINDGRICDVFEGVVGMMLVRSGYSSGLHLQQSLTGLEDAQAVGVGVHSSVATHRGSVQSLVDGDGKLNAFNSPFSTTGRNVGARAHRPSMLTGSTAAAAVTAATTQQSAAVQPPSPSRRPSVAGVSIPPPVVEEIRKFIWEVKETRDYCSNRLKSLVGQLTNIVPSSAPLPVDPSLQSADESKQAAIQQRAIAKRSVGLLRQYRDISKLNQLHPTHRLMISLSELQDFISAYLVKVHQTVFDDQAMLRSRLQKLAFESNGDSDVPQSSVNSLLALRALSKSLVDNWFQSSGDEVPAVATGKPPTFTASSEDAATLESLQKHRRYALDLLRAAKEETFAELFSIGSTGDSTKHLHGHEVYDNEDDQDELYGQPHQLHWSVGKIRTVIPCLGDQYGHLYQAALDTMLKIIRSLTIILATSQQKLSAGSAQRLAGNLHELLPTLLNLYSEFSLKTQALKQTAETTLADVEKLYAQWYGQEISVAASWAQQGRNKVVDGLLAAGCEHPGLHSESAAPDTLICRGIESVRRQLQIAKENTSVLEKSLAEIEIALPFPNVDAEIQELLASVLQLRQMDSESDNIISVFDEQFGKWRKWHDIAIGQQQKMLEIKAYLIEKFASWVPESAVTLPEKSSLATIDSESFEDCDDSNAAGVLSRDDSAVMDDLIRKQNDLLTEQQSNADRLAEVAIAAMRRRSSTAAIQQHQHENQHQQQVKSKQRRPHAANPPRRAQMMRNLSMTAAAIQRQSRLIDSDLKHAAPLQSLESKYQELYEQMRLLQEQQRALLNSQGFPLIKPAIISEPSLVATQPGRRESILSQAKEKLISLIKNVVTDNNGVPATNPQQFAGRRESFAPPPPAQQQYRETRPIMQQHFAAAHTIPLPQPQPSAPVLPTANSGGMSARRKPVNYNAVNNTVPATPDRRQSFNGDVGEVNQYEYYRHVGGTKKRNSTVSPIRFDLTERRQNNANALKHGSGARRYYSNETDFTDFYRQPNEGNGTFKAGGGMAGTSTNRRNTFLDIHNQQPHQHGIKLKQKQQGLPQTSQEAIDQITRYCASMRRGSLNGGTEQLIP